MKPENIRLIHDAIGAAGKGAGFTKSGSSWYANRTDSMLVISPQKSQYGQKYYLNLGIFFKALGSKDRPKENECHLRARIGNIVGTESQMLAEKLLDFEAGKISTEARREALTTIMLTEVIPFIEQCSSLEGARTALHEGKLDELPINKELRELLQRTS
jgi:hypothetical protein